MLLATNVFMTSGSSEGLRVVIPFESQSLKKEIKEAAKSGARFAVLLGEEELNQGNVIVRDLIYSEQSEVSQAQLLDTLKKLRLSIGDEAGRFTETVLHEDLVKDKRP